MENENKEEPHAEGKNRTIDDSRKKKSLYLRKANNIRGGSFFIDNVLFMLREPKAMGDFLSISCLCNEGCNPPPRFLSQTQ